MTANVIDGQVLSLLGTAVRQEGHSGAIDWPMSQLLIGKRRQQRTKMVVPVRLWLKGDGGSVRSHLAHTLDVSDHGVRLAGFDGVLAPEETFDVQYRHKRARFRVVWVHSRDGSREKQVGAECLEPEKRIWGVDLPELLDQYAGNPHKG